MSTSKIVSNYLNLPATHRDIIEVSTEYNLDYYGFDISPEQGSDEVELLFNYQLFPDERKELIEELEDYFSTTFGQVAFTDDIEFSNRTQLNFRFFHPIDDTL